MARFLTATEVVAMLAPSQKTSSTATPRKTVTIMKVRLKWNGMAMNAQLLMKMNAMLQVLSLLAAILWIVQTSVLLGVLLLAPFSLLALLLFLRTFDISGKSPVDFVQLFLTCTILENIVTETNRYADDYIQSHNLPPNIVHK